MLDWIQDLINTLGYPGIVFLMFLENVFPPIPSEAIMPFAGFTASRGDLSVIGVIIAGTVGSVLGALPLYYIGKYVGEARIKRWADRYGKWFTVSSKDIDKAKGWFERHGGAAVFLCRLVPGIRSLISIPAGFSSMHMPTFLLYTAVGSSMWTALLTYLGVFLGNNYEQVETYLGPAGKIIMAVLLVVLIAWLFLRKRAQRAA